MYRDMTIMSTSKYCFIISVTLDPFISVPYTYYYVGNISYIFEFA